MTSKRTIQKNKKQNKQNKKEKIEINLTISVSPSQIKAAKHFRTLTALRFSFLSPLDLYLLDKTCFENWVVSLIYTYTLMQVGILLAGNRQVSN